MCDIYAGNVAQYNLESSCVSDNWGLVEGVIIHRGFVGDKVMEPPF